MCLVLTLVFNGVIKVFKPAKYCLPDPKGSLAGSVPPHVITSANLEVK